MSEERMSRSKILSIAEVLEDHEPDEDEEVVEMAVDFRKEVGQAMRQLLDDLPTPHYHGEHEVEQCWVCSNCLEIGPVQADPAWKLLKYPRAPQPFNNAWSHTCVESGGVVKAHLAYRSKHIAQLIAKLEWHKRYVMDNAGQGHLINTLLSEQVAVIKRSELLSAWEGIGYHPMFTDLENAITAQGITVLHDD